MPRQDWKEEGKDEVGKYADCKFVGSQFEDLIRYYLSKNDLELAAYVAFGTETFGRPERLFQAKHDFALIKEKIARTKASWDMDWIYDERLVADRRTQLEIYPLLKEKATIESFDLEVF